MLLGPCSMIGAPAPRSPGKKACVPAGFRKMPDIRKGANSPAISRVNPERADFEVE